LMMGQNAHSVKVVGFRIKSSQPASTAPFCRCTLLQAWSQRPPFANSSQPETQHRDFPFAAGI